MAHCSLSVVLIGITNTSNAEELVPENSSQNTVIVTNDSYQINEDFPKSYSGTFERIFGGGGPWNSFSLADSSNNTVNFFGGTITDIIRGGYTYKGISIGNRVNIYGGDINIIYGGDSHGGNVQYNVVTVNGGNIKTVIGGMSYAGNSELGSGVVVQNNQVVINSGTITDNISGARTNWGRAENNIVTINGGTISGSIHGGWAENNTAANNVINIYGKPDLSDATLYAGRGISVSGNVLNIYTSGITAKQIHGFANLNFYLPSDFNPANGDVALTLTDGQTDLSQTNLNMDLAASGAANITAGQQIILLHNGNGITLGDSGSSADLINDGTLAKGISVDYNIANLGLSEDGNSYIATLGELVSNELNKQTDILTSGAIDSAGLLDSGTERIYEWLPPEDVNSMPTTEFSPFVGLGGSVFKVKTADGQKLKSKNGGLDFGVARKLDNRHGYFIFGPITDYGQDYYESHLTYQTSDGAKNTDGAGNSRYFTAGMIGRLVNSKGMYYEGSFRAGRIHTSFSSDNFLVHSTPTHADYSASMPCYAGHVRVGWKNTIGGSSKLDVYGIYSLNKVNGFTTRLSTGEDYKFSSVSSGRMRIGTRLTREYRDNIWYSGLAWVQEFTGETRGEYMGMSTNKADLKGTSGLIELGWRRNTSNTSHTMLDTSIIGWVGHQKGVTFAAKYKSEF